MKCPNRPKCHQLVVGGGLADFLVQKNPQCPQYWQYVGLPKGSPVMVSGLKLLTNTFYPRGSTIVNSSSPLRTYGRAERVTSSDLERSSCYGNLGCYRTRLPPRGGNTCPSLGSGSLV